MKEVGVLCRPNLVKQLSETFQPDALVVFWTKSKEEPHLAPKTTIASVEMSTKVVSPKLV